MAAYKRVLLKLSGEALMAGRSYGIDPERLENYIDEIIEIKQNRTYEKVLSEDSYDFVVFFNQVI